MYWIRMCTCLVNGRSGEAMIREYLLAPLYTRENAGWIRSIVLLFICWANHMRACLILGIG